MDGFMPVFPHHMTSMGQKLHSSQYHLSWDILFFTWLPPSLPLALHLAITSSWKPSLTTQPKLH